jgi:hypothetical protein
MVWSARHGRNIAMYLTSPRKAWTSVVGFGMGQLEIVWFSMIVVQFLG